MYKIFEDGFENGSYQFRDAPELVCPIGWFPKWILGSPEQLAEGYLKRPEYSYHRREVDAERVHLGNHSAKFFVTYATMVATLCYTLEVPVGTKVVMTAWGSLKGWDVGDRGAGLAMRVGIDPTGVQQRLDSTVIKWGAWHGQYNDWNGMPWYQFSVSAVAEAPSITILLGAANDYRAKDVSVWWDDVEAYADLVTPPTPPGGLTEEQVRAIARQEALKVMLETAQMVVGNTNP